MRHFLDNFARRVKRWVADVRLPVHPQKTSLPVPFEAHQAARPWWIGLSWKTDSNEEFAKWWNHWMSRIPHTRPVISTSRSGEKDV